MAYEKNSLAPALFCPRYELTYPTCSFLDDPLLRAHTDRNLTSTILNILKKTAEAIANYETNYPLSSKKLFGGGLVNYMLAPFPRDPFGQAAFTVFSVAVGDGIKLALQATQESLCSGYLGEIRDHVFQVAWSYPVTSKKIVALTAIGIAAGVAIQKGLRPRDAFEAIGGGFTGALFLNYLYRSFS